MKTSPARFISHVRVKTCNIGEESDDFEMILGASPVDWETAIKVNENRKLRIGLQMWSVRLLDGILQDHFLYIEQRFYRSHFT